MTDASSSAGMPEHRAVDAQYFMNGTANRAKAAEYFLAQFVVRRLESLDNAADIAKVQDLLDTLLTRSAGMPAEAWLAEQDAAQQPVEIVAPPLPEPSADDAFPPVADAPAEETAAPEPESPALPHVPDIPVALAVEELLATMSINEAMYAETTMIYDLCKQRDELQEQSDSLQAQVNAGRAPADAPDTVENLQKQVKAKETEIQRHRDIRMRLQEQEARNR